MDSIEREGDLLLLFQFNHEQNTTPSLLDSTVTVSSTPIRTSASHPDRGWSDRT